MLSEKDLAKLRSLAVKAYPIKHYYIESTDALEKDNNNYDFIVAAKNFIPELIDEILEYRNNEELEYEELEHESDIINIYESEVHIANNYITNYVDMESIEKLIVKKLNEGNKPTKVCCNE